MKERFKKISEKLDTYIKTKQFRWMRGLVLVLGFALTNCVSFLGGYFLNRDDNMIYKKNINALVESQASAAAIQTPVTTVPEETAPPVTTPVTTSISVNGEVLATKIRLLFFPETEYTYANTCDFENRNTINDVKIPLTRKSFKIRYNGLIKASSDTSAISVSADNTARVITVIIPQAEITSHEIDPDSFVISDKKDNLFNPILTDDYAATCELQNPEMENKAIKSGLFEKVYDETEKIISDFIGQDKMIAENYTVKFIIEKSY